MKVYVIHGEQTISEAFAQTVRQRFGLQTHVPGLGSTIALAPLEPSMAEEGAEETGWKKHLFEVIRKAEEIRALWEQSPQLLTPSLLERLESELAKSAGALDGILKETAKVSVKEAASGAR